MFVPAAATREHTLVVVAALVALVLAVVVALGLGFAPDALFTVRPRF